MPTISSDEHVAEGERRPGGGVCDGVEEYDELEDENIGVVGAAAVVLTVAVVVLSVGVVDSGGGGVDVVVGGGGIVVVAGDVTDEVQRAVLRISAAIAL